MNGKAVGTGKTALISDDDEFFRVALKTVLSERLGFQEVIESETFDGAVEELARRKDIALALFDLNMPGMNNWENLRSVRECFPAVRVAVVSASQDRSDILIALSIGLHGYISKGLGVMVLARALESICEGIVYLPPFLPELPISEAKLASRSDPESHLMPQIGVLTGFTTRQREVLNLLVDGKSNKEMARKLNLSEGTIKFHLAALFRALRATNRVEAATSGARILDQVR